MENHMKKIFASSLILLLSACNNYELHEVGKNTLLLNKNKGDVSIVDKGMVIELPKYSLLLEKHLSSSGIFKGKLQLSINSKVTFNRVFYKIVLEGMKTSHQDGSNSQKDFYWFKKAMKEHDVNVNIINLNYQDKDAYLLFDKEIELKDFSYNDFDSNGVRTGLVYEGSFSINPQFTNKVNMLSYTYVISALGELYNKP
jgi:hypothetical protein